MDWKYFFSAFGGTTAALAIAVYLSKLLLGEKLKREFEIFTDKLKAIAKKQEIKFSSLHATRAGIIAQLYAKVKKTKRAISFYSTLNSLSLTVNPPISQERVRQERHSADKLITELFQFTDINKLYFSKETNKALNDLHDTFLKQITYIGGSGDELTYRQEEVAYDDYVNEIEHIETEIEILIYSIELDFQTLLGVIEEKEE